MELVYLWVDNYKNIHSQGFSFSPKFNCDFDCETLTIKDNVDSNGNKQYIENFFGDNINVTAIVGKNGSGKSSVSEAIVLGSSRFFNSQSKLKIFTIFEDNGEFYFNSTDGLYVSIGIILYNDKQIRLKSLNDLDIFTLHSSNALDDFSNEFCRNIQDNGFCGFMFDLETTPQQKNFFSFPDKTNGIIDLNKINLLNNKYMIYSYVKIGKEKIKILLSTLSDNYHTNLYFTPDKFQLHFDFYETYLKFIKNENYQNILKIYFSDNTNKTNNTINKDTLTKLTSLYIMFRFREVKVGDLFDTVNSNYFKNESLIILLQKLERIIRDIESYDKQIENADENHKNKLELELGKKNFIEDELSEINNTLISIFYNVKEVDLLIGKYIKSLFYDIYTAMQYLKYILYVKENFNYFYEKTLVSNNLKLLAELPYYIECQLWTEHKSGNDINFNSLSYGEKVINRMFYNLVYFSENINNKKFKNMIILFDEVENGLHPEWQRKFLDFMQKIITTLIENDFFDSIHFIPVTHSPFLLSDIPTQNILFLDTYKDEDKKVGSCKVLIDTEVLSKKQTFGTNIHELLSNSFFMGNGLMGEFAKNKIQEIMGFLNNEKTIDEILTKESEIKQVIESIGEPFLKQKLLDMYYKKFQDEALQKARKKELLAEQKLIEAELKRYD